MKDLKIDESTGLVLEGGGMRGVFTCGRGHLSRLHNRTVNVYFGLASGIRLALN